MSFLHLARSRNPYNSQIMGKVNYHSEKIEKTQTLQNYEFLKCFAWSRNPYNSQNMGKAYYGKSIGKYKHPKAMGFFQILRIAEIHTIPKTWEKLIPTVREKHRKTNISKLKVSYIFLVKQKSMQFAKHRMSESPSYGTYRQFPSSTLPHRCWVSGNSCNPQSLKLYEFP